MAKLSEWLKQRAESALGMAGLLPAIVRAISDSYSTTSPRREIVIPGTKPHSAFTAGVLSLLMVLFFVLIDYVYVPQTSFTLFYLLIVAFAAWSSGRGAGIFIALISSLGLLVHEIRESAESSFGPALYWNFIVQIGVYLFAALLMSAVRSLTENLERRVKDRTIALEREITDRKQMEEQLRKTMQQFRQLAENITDAFWMRDAGEARMAYVSPAYEKIWGRSCKSLYQSPKLWLEAVHPEDRERVARTIQTTQSVGEYSQEYRIVRPDGSERWIRDRAFPIRDVAGKVVRIVGIAEDITERRRLEREILEISDREQARIGQDLHDSLCQKLISIAFDNNSLEQKLANRAVPEASSAQQIGEVLDDAITEARALARGLFPVQLETDGLSVALEQLAAGVSARTKINCRLECPVPVSGRDNAMATHLYRIAQEAVNNAVKHGQAKSILIRLTTQDDFLELSVTDDGTGIAKEMVSTGMGFHTMNYRARTIGGTLTIEPGPNGGTVVSCSARQQGVIKNGNGQTSTSE